MRETQTIRDLREQVLMPWGEPTPVVLREGRIAGDIGKFDLTFTVTLSGRRLDLMVNIVKSECADRAVTFSTLSLDVGPEATCTLSKRGTPCWHHEWQLGIAKLVESGPFAELYASNLGFLVGVGTGEEGICPRPAAQAFRKLCAAVEQLAVELCDHRAREVAAEFHPSVRLRVYGLIVRHGDRVAQMAEVCPGVLVLILAIQASSARSAQGIVASILAGKRLSLVLDEACSEWRRVHAADSNKCTTELRFQRQFIRRVPASVELPAVALTMPSGTEVSDIPQDVATREAWYQVMVQLAVQGTPLRGLDSASAQRFVGFLSKHALILSHYANTEHKSEQAAVAELIDYVLRSGEKVPSRNSSPERVCEAVNDWHISSWTFAKYPPETPLGQCKMDTPLAPLSIVALENVGALQDEGRTMKHCIASYAESAVSGTFFVFRAVFDEERLTIALEESNERLYLSEVKGKFNRLASPKASAAIHTWIDMQRDAQETEDQT